MTEARTVLLHRMRQVAETGDRPSRNTDLMAQAAAEMETMALDIVELKAELVTRDTGREVFEVATFQSGTHVPDVRYYVDKDEAEYWAKRGANARLAPIGLPRDTPALAEILAFCADRTAEARKHAVSLEQFIAELSAAMAIDGKVVITPGSVLHDRLADAADKIRERRQAPFASPRHRSTGGGVGQQCR